MGRNKNSKLLYYFRAAVIYLWPKFFLRNRIKELEKEAFVLEDKEYIEKRVNYYNKLDSSVTLPASATPLSNHVFRRKRGNSVYFFDTYEIIRFFKQSFRWLHEPGDITKVFDYPTVVKSRPIATDVIDNCNSILLKLDKVRHFFFVNDPIPFEKKKSIVLFRGAVHGKPHRQRFLEMYIENSLCDLRDTAKDSKNPQSWQQKKLMTIREHLNYRYIMALEGNDVASNLKWVMSSNSIAVMPRPKYETWFMEGTLIPNYHYIEIKPDYSDLIEKIAYYNNHLDEAKSIIKNANEYIKQFQDKKRERLISLLVMDKYFQMTGQYE